MKVLQLISSSGFFGAENMMIELSKQLRKEGIDPIVGVFNNRQDTHLEVAEVAEADRFRVEVFECNGRVDFGTVMKIRRFLKAEKAQFLHSHGYKSNLYGSAACLGMNIRRIATCHNWLGEQRRMRLYAGLDKRFLYRFDRVVAVSDSVEGAILKTRIKKEKVVVVPNGIDTGRFEGSVGREKIRRELGIEKEARVVGCVGRLSQEKGQTALLDAMREVFRKLPDVVLMVVGDGPMRTELIGRADEIHQKFGSEGKVVFAGVRRDMPAIYAAIDVFVLPSLTEGLPMALLEAMAAGKAVVASDVGAISRVMEQGACGRLVAAGKEEDLTDAILELLQDEPRRRFLGVQAKQRIQEDYSAERMGRRYLALYQDVLR